MRPMAPPPHAQSALRLLSIGAAMVLLVSALVPPDALPESASCVFKRATGAPCPGCGLTHGFLALARGRVVEAWQSNVMTFPLFLVVTLLVPAPLAARACPKLTTRLTLPRLAGAAVVLASALVAFGVWRLLAGGP
jgi:hypothetical protein